MEENYKEKYEALLAGVNPEMLDDAITLANSRVTEEVPFADAIGSVVERYPQFKGIKGSVSGETASEAAPGTAITTGAYTGATPPALSGVEAEFLARNPGIKL
ncbi:MAG: hypothetical protein LBM41_00840 [Ruminococcus sp.]|jgi:hypothetical protein|nr:hypothetical protein [Ruminococcus sp.]